jgi:twitching motility protein PilT
MSTLHTIDAAETVARMVEFFPPEKQEVIRAILAGVLRGVVSQRLLPKLDGGRVAAVEVMVMNARIADLIREGRADEITDAVAEGEFFQMQTFTQALIEHVLAGKVDPEIAANAATNRHDFLVSLEQAQKRQRADEAAVAAENAIVEQAAQPGPDAGSSLLNPPELADEGFSLRVAPTG